MESCVQKDADDAQRYDSFSLRKSFLNTSMSIISHFPLVSDIMRLSVAQVSPMGGPGSPLQAFGSSLSIGNQQRIETVTDWPMIARKYRVLVGKEDPHLLSEEGQAALQGSTINIKQQA